MTKQQILQEKQHGKKPKYDLSIDEKSYLQAV